MTGHTINEIESKNLLRMYYEGLKFEDMYVKTNIPKRKIRKFFKDKNMPLVKRYRIIEDYFDTIDTKNKAYWLGYIYCDGFVGEGKYNNIVLSSVDEHVIDSFIDNIALEGKGFIKKTKLAKDRKNSFAVNTLYESRFSSKYMKESLIKRNVFIDRKTKSFVDYHDIPKENLKYLLFGILDADAHVSIGVKDDNRSVIHLYSSKELLEEYKEFMNILNIKYSIKTHNEKDCYYIRLLFSDYSTRRLISEYIENSLMYRKIAPSLLKSSVE